MTTQTVRIQLDAGWELWVMLMILLAHLAFILALAVLMG